MLRWGGKGKFLRELKSDQISLRSHPFHEQKDQKKAEQGTPIFAENPLRNRRTEPDQPSRADSGDQVPRRPGIQRFVPPGGAPRTPAQCTLPARRSRFSGAHWLGGRCTYTLLIPIFRFFIQPMSSKLFVSKERNSRWYLLGFRKNSSQAALNSANVS